MADYEIVLMCDECAGAHSMGSFLVTLNDGPADAASIGNYYAGKELPKELADLLQGTVLCEGKQKKLVIRDLQKQAFLVAVARKKITGQHFKGERVFMDNRDFEDCTFDKACTMVITGAGGFTMTRCDIYGTWCFTGPAAQVFSFLEGIRQAAPNVFEKMIASMRAGVPRVDPPVG